MKFGNIFCFVAILFAVGNAPAKADVVFDTGFIADFEFNVWSNGPLGGAGFPTDVFIPFRAIGDLSFTLDDAVNNPAATTAPFLNVTGDLVGVSPGPFLPYTISPIQFLGGDLTNIVRDIGGNITSADIDGLSMTWEMIGSPGGTPIRLYTKVGLEFNGQTSGIPFSDGMVLTGPSVFGVYLDTGMGVNDPLAVFGRNRVLTAIPEPTSAALLLVPFGLFAFKRRRRS